VYIVTRSTALPRRSTPEQELKIVTMMPYLVNCQNEIRCPLRAAIPIATTFALAATVVPFPPKSAPSANAHQRD
jgi:hypothetical protein